MWLLSGMRSVMCLRSLAARRGQDTKPTWCTCFATCGGSGGVASTVTNSNCSSPDRMRGDVHAASSARVAARMEVKCSSGCKVVRRAE